MHIIINKLIKITFLETFCLNDKKIFDGRDNTFKIL